MIKIKYFVKKVKKLKRSYKKYIICGIRYFKMIKKNFMVIKVYHDFFGIFFVKKL